MVLCPYSLGRWATQDKAARVINVFLPKQGQVVTPTLFSSQSPTGRPCYFCGSELQTGKRLHVSTVRNGHALESLGSRGGKWRVFSDVTANFVTVGKFSDMTETSPLGIAGVSIK